MEGGQSFWRKAEIIQANWAAFCICNRHHFHSDKHCDTIFLHIIDGTLFLHEFLLDDSLLQVDCLGLNELKNGDCITHFINESFSNTNIVPLTIS